MNYSTFCPANQIDFQCVQMKKMMRKKVQNEKYASKGFTDKKKKTN